MPIDYWSILKRSYQVTIRYPGLWLLGLLLAGGFNANFFYWANLRLRWRSGGGVVLDWAQQNFHASHIAIVVPLALLGAAVIIVAANWAKIIFVLYASDILKLQRMRPAVPERAEPLSALRESPRYLVSVTAMSIFTMVATGIVVTVLGGTPQVLFDSRGLVWLIAVLLLTAFGFFFSCLNIFATFFIIFYRRRFGAALNLSLDLIVSRARVIVEMAVVLLLIYGLCFFAGASFLFAFRLAAANLLTPLLQHGLVPPAVFFGLVTGFSGLLLWAWLAIVNTFFNVSLLLLFAQLVRPPYHPEFKSLMADLPLASASPVSNASFMDKLG